MDPDIPQALRLQGILIGAQRGLLQLLGVISTIFGLAA